MQAEGYRAQSLHVETSKTLYYRARYGSIPGVLSRWRETQAHQADLPKPGLLSRGLGHLLLFFSRTQSSPNFSLVGTPHFSFRAWARSKEL